MKKTTCFSNSGEKPQTPKNLKIITSTRLMCNAQTFILSFLVIVYNTVL